MTESRPDVSSPGATVGYDASTDTYHTTHDWTGADSLAEAIVTSVAAVTGADPLRTEPLFDIVDPDALERLFGRRDRPCPGDDARIELTYMGCPVTVHRDGRIDIGPPTGR